MDSVSLFDLGIYSIEWIKDFYTQAGVWWGADLKHWAFIKSVLKLSRACVVQVQKRFWIWAQGLVQLPPLLRTQVTR